MHAAQMSNHAFKTKDVHETNHPRIMRSGIFSLIVFDTSAWPNCVRSVCVCVAAQHQ
jgi:hypothetical protein